MFNRNSSSSTAAPTTLTTSSRRKNLHLLNISKSGTSSGEPFLTVQSAAPVPTTARRGNSPASGNPNYFRPATTSPSSAESTSTSQKHNNNTPNTNTNTQPVPIPNTAAMATRRASPDHLNYFPSSPSPSTTSISMGKPNYAQQQPLPRKFSITHLVESSTSAINRRKSTGQAAAQGMPMRRRFSAKLALGVGSSAAGLGKSPDEMSSSPASSDGHHEMDTSYPSSVSHSTNSPSSHYGSSHSFVNAYSNDIDDYRFTAILGRGASGVVYSATHLPDSRPAENAQAGMNSRSGFLSKSLDRALSNRNEEQERVQKTSSPTSRCSSPTQTSPYHPNANRPVAVKAIDMDNFERDQIDQLRKEIQIMSLCRHPNLLPIYQTIVTGSYMYIVTPLLTAGSASDVLKCAFPDGMDSISVLTVMKQVLQGLAYLHDNQLIHRDVKAANILLDKRNGNAQLADFGVSSSLTEYARGNTIPHGGEADGASTQRANGKHDENTRKTFVGTLCWMAPEVMDQRTYGAGTYGAKADLWSFGMTCLELLQGQVPYARFPPIKVYLLVLNHDPPYLEEGQYTKAFREMVNGCLSRKPQERLPARELLKHPVWRKAKDPTYLVRSLHLESMNVAAWREEHILRQQRRQLQRQQQAQEQYGHYERALRSGGADGADKEYRRTNVPLKGYQQREMGRSRSPRNVPAALSIQDRKAVSEPQPLSPGHWDFETTPPPTPPLPKSVKPEEMAISQLVPRVMTSGSGTPSPTTSSPDAIMPVMEQSTHRRVGRFSVTVSKGHRSGTAAPRVTQVP